MTETDTQTDTQEQTEDNGVIQKFLDRLNDMMSKQDEQAPADEGTAPEDETQTGEQDLAAALKQIDELKAENAKLKEDKQERPIVEQRKAANAKEVEETDEQKIAKIRERKREMGLY